MKRLGLVLAGLALVGAVNTADAQLTMQMTNGWSATFAGNVNAFWIYTTNSSLDTDGSGNFSTSGKLNGIGTGLLPAFFTFEAKGKEGNTDLGIHFGFAPQVSAGRNVASSFGTDAAGAQIDMRQVYLTVGGTWGQILAGKELGLFERQAILTDMTLFGAGVNIGLPWHGPRPHRLRLPVHGLPWTVHVLLAGRQDGADLVRRVRADHDRRQQRYTVLLRRHSALRDGNHVQAEDEEHQEHRSRLG